MVIRSMDSSNASGRESQSARRRDLDEENDPRRASVSSRLGKLVSALGLPEAAHRAWNGRLIEIRICRFPVRRFVVLLTAAQTQEPPMIVVFGEGRGFRVVWLLEEMGLAYRLRPVDLLAGVEKAPEFLAINPGGVIPAIQDGAVTMV